MSTLAEDDKELDEEQCDGDRPMLVGVPGVDTSGISNRAGGNSGLSIGRPSSPM